MPDASGEQAHPTPAPRSLHPRMALVWALQSAIAAVVLGVVLLAAEVGARLLAGLRPPWPAGLPALVAALAVGALGWWLAWADYRRWSYQLADQALELRHGVIRRVHSAIPYFRVQHIDITQGPLERALGLSRLVIHTAAATTDATIPGVATPEADDLRRVILARTGTGDAV